MSSYTDELRRTALAPCDHPDGELCEHRSAALAVEVMERGPGVRFDIGALGAYMALGLAVTLIILLAGVNISRAVFG